MRLTPIDDESFHWANATGLLLRRIERNDNIFSIVTDVDSDLQVLNAILLFYP